MTLMTLTSIDDNENIVLSLVCELVMIVCLCAVDWFSLLLGLTQHCDFSCKKQFIEHLRSTPSCNLIEEASPRKSSHLRIVAAI